VFWPFSCVRRETHLFFGGIVVVETLHATSLRVRYRMTCEDWSDGGK
jgi:hypothetical protein